MISGSENRGPPTLSEDKGKLQRHENPGEVFRIYSSILGQEFWKEYKGRGGRGRRGREGRERKRRGEKKNRENRCGGGRVYVVLGLCVGECAYMYMEGCVCMCMHAVGESM